MVPTSEDTSSVWFIILMLIISLGTPSVGVTDIEVVVTRVAANGGFSSFGQVESFVDPLHTLVIFIDISHFMLEKTLHSIVITVLFLCCS